MIARHVLRVSQIDSHIPFGKDIAPLRPYTCIERVGGCYEVIACDAGEHIERNVFSEAVAVIKDPRAEQRMTIHVLVEFDSRAPDVLPGDRPPPAKSEVTT